MFRSLLTAKTGMDAMQFNVDVISNNLANVSTTGFKRERPVFQDLLYQNLRQPGAATSQSTQLPTGLDVGTGVSPVATARIFMQGNMQLTDGPLDMAINGAGFFQIAMPDGKTAYTRDGSFQVDSQGTVVTSNGYPLEPALQVPLGTTKVTIAKDGTVTAIIIMMPPRQLNWAIFNWLPSLTLRVCRRLAVIYIYKRQQVVRLQWVRPAPIVLARSIKVMLRHRM